MKLVLDIFWVSITIGVALIGYKLCRELYEERD
jgi:hypothetical protein